MKATLATFGCVTRGSPTSAPKPVTTLNTPGGSPASTARRANSSAEAEVNSDGFTTTVLPAASAGATFQAIKQQRRVPRHDCGDDAERFVPREVEHVRLVDRDDAAFDLVGEAAEVAEPLADVAALGEHLGDQLAVVAHLDLGQALGVLQHQVAEPAEDLPARGRSERGPRAAIECRIRGLDGAIDLGLAAARQQRPDITRERILALEHRAAIGVVPLAADMGLIALDRGGACFGRHGHLFLPIERVCVRAPRAPATALLANLARLPTVRCEYAPKRDPSSR